MWEKSGGLGRWETSGGLGRWDREVGNKWWVSEVGNKWWVREVENKWWDREVGNDLCFFQVLQKTVNKQMLLVLNSVMKLYSTSLFRKTCSPKNLCFEIFQLTSINKCFLNIW
jgi:hypothetical protein